MRPNLLLIFQFYWFFYLILHDSTLLANGLQCSRPSGTVNKGTSSSTIGPGNNRTIRDSSTPDHDQIADLVLILDVSGSLSPHEHQFQRDSIDRVISSLKISPDNVRLSIIRFDSVPVTLIPLNMGTTAAAVRQVLGQVHADTRERYKATNFPDALDLATEQFIKHGRPRVIKAAVMVTDGYENCSPKEVMPYCVQDYMTCDQIADKCPRSLNPQAFCYKSGWKGAVLDEAKKLKNAGGGNSVTLSILGIGQRLRHGMGRLKCLSSENAFSWVPTYAELSKMILELVASQIRKKTGEDCQCEYGPKNCQIDKKQDCKSHTPIKIVKKAGANGQPCPKETTELEWCPPWDCGITPPPTNTSDTGAAVKPKKSEDKGKPLAWYLVVVILLAVLTVVLCVGILLALMIKRKRRRAKTTGIQPTMRESIAEQSTSGKMGSEMVDASARGVSRSVQPSTRFFRVFKKNPSVRFAAPPSNDSAPRSNSQTAKSSFSENLSAKKSDIRDRSNQAGSSFLPTRTSTVKPSKAFSRKHTRSRK